MSERDQALVESLGLPVARMAEALSKSRQTVTRGIRSADDYFKTRDLVKVLGEWKKTDLELYTIASRKICDFYPDIAESVLEALQLSSATPFYPLKAGEYWLICGDYLGFRNDLTECSKQIDSVCEAPDSQLKIFINRRDFGPVMRITRKYTQGVIMPIICNRVDLKLVPSTLLRIDMNDTMELFGASDFGFTALSRLEAARLRIAIQDILLNSVEEPTLAQSFDAD